MPLPGYFFYGALLVVAIQFVMGLGAVTGAAATGLGAPAAIAGTAVNLGLTGAQVGAIVAALTALLAERATNVISTKNALNSFPGSQWPNVIKE